MSIQMRVLVVEDYGPLQESLAKGLREAGFAVDTTRDGKEGLWYATGNEYDVIILDLMLRGMDGLGRTGLRYRVTILSNSMSITSTLQTGSAGDRQ